MSERMYNDPAGGNPSDVGTQFNDFHYHKKALIEARKQAFFGQMADVRAMPKHFGKKIKQYHYLPILDDANINDQGIDATSATSTVEKTIVINKPDTNPSANGMLSYYAVGQGANDGAATTAAEAKAVSIFKNLEVFDTNYATTKTAVEAAGWTVDESAASVPVAGNLYGSSKDIGSIPAKMPTLTENGGRVNRVGMKRVEIEGEIHKYGFFDEYTQESVDFDTDSELTMHVNREMVNAAHEITEDLLQIDLLTQAGITRYGGDASSVTGITGENGVTASLITYEDLMRLSIDLDNNRCPKSTKIISGSRMVDTKVIDAARYLYIGSELIPMVKRMKDLHNNPAFIPVQSYASAGNLAIGEIGSIDQFRIIVVPEMMYWAGAGAPVTTNEGYRTSVAPAGHPNAGSEAYDVFPMLVVGSGSFTTIGFQTEGKTVKFKITHKKPGKETADRNDPYGEVGFMSIKWYYGSMILRPERIAVCKAVAEW